MARHLQFVRDHLRKRGDFLGGVRAEGDAHGRLDSRELPHELIDDVCAGRAASRRLARHELVLAVDVRGEAFEEAGQIRMADDFPRFADVLLDIVDVVAADIDGTDDMHG